MRIAMQAIRGDGRGALLALCADRGLQVFKTGEEKPFLKDALPGRDQLQRGPTLLFQGPNRVAVADGPVLRNWGPLSWPRSYVTVYRGHQGRITSIDYDRQTSRLPTASTDGTLKIWDLSSVDSSSDIFLGRFDSTAAGPPCFQPRWNAAGPQRAETV